MYEVHACTIVPLAFVCDTYIDMYLRRYVYAAAFWTALP